MYKKIKNLLKSLGPGFITGASDDDPSGIATYSQTGAQFGYTQLWTSLFSFPFMAIIQEMCGRIGLVTGRGIAVIAREHYAKSILYIAVFLLLVANTINIGADLGAMASATGLLIGLPFVVILIFFTVLTLLLEVLVPYPAYSKILKYLTVSLFAYVFTAIIIKQDWRSITLATLIPTISFKEDYIFNIVAILGTTISPYLFFWQADEEVEEEIEDGKLNYMGHGTPQITKRDIKKMRADTLVGMFFSNIVMFFIIVVAASTLHLHDITTIQTADQAASALKPFAGEFAFLLFALGIIGTGLLAVPVLAGSAAYAIAETFRWKAGLGLKFRRAHGFYGVITIATIVGLLVNFTPVKPFQMLYYAAILNGVVAPPLIVLLLFIANNKKIMGDHTNSLLSNVFGIAIALIMGIASVLLFANLIKL
ncbi:MAG TPA: divalent metal cation transporter [Patescibacteria group bacterium]|nr:divalent metal cation transporter [Patescibacteria group bacterium]